MGEGSVSLGYSGWGVALTSQPHIAPSGDSWPCSRMRFTFNLSLRREDIIEFSADSDEELERWKFLYDEAESEW
jgi:hypothetical protein